MVTYGLCRTKPQVRFLAPHPLFLFLAILLLSGSAMAADQQVSSSDFDHYAAAPGSLASSITSFDSLARAGGLFGVDWYYSWLSNAVTSIDGVSMQDRADGVQELATATYRTFQGVEEAIAASAFDLSAFELFMQQDYVNSRYQGRDWTSNHQSGTPLTSVSIPELLASISGNTYFSGFGFVNSNMLWANGEIIKAGRAYGLSEILGNGVSGIATLMAGVGLSGLKRSHLAPSGLSYFETDNRKTSLVGVLSDGFLGLASLAFGDESHTIYGLSYTGDDKEGVRGSWSLADITANGFSGLAHLIGGSANTAHGGRYGTYRWVDPTDPTNVRDYEFGSLFELFGILGDLQNSLAKLEYVYASQEDIDFKDQEKPNMDAVKDHFFGDGEGAVNPDQIKEVAGIGSDLKEAFSSPVSIADFFKMLSSSGSYNFFSQESASDMNPLSSGGGAAIASADDSDPFADLVQGEDGLWYPVEPSVFDLYSYLEGFS